MKKFLTFVALTLAATPAYAEPTAAEKWEYAYIGLSAVDLAETLYALDHGAAEANPLLGKHPKAWKLVAFKVAGTGLQYVLFREVQKKDPHTALRVAQISVVLQGAVVGLNMRFVF